MSLIRDYLGEVDTKAEEDQLFKDLPPEQALRLLQAFGAPNVAAQATSTAAGKNATVADFEEPVRRFQSSVRFQDRSETAAEDTEDAYRGLEVFPFQQAKEIAQRRLDRLKESGKVGAFEQLVHSDEALIERSVFDRFDTKLERLRGAGADTTAADNARKRVLDFPGFNAVTGYNDRELSRFVQNVTIVGTQYNDRDSLADPSPVLDANQ